MNLTKWPWVENFYRLNDFLFWQRFSSITLNTRLEIHLFFWKQLYHWIDSRLLLLLFRSFFEVRLTPRKWGHLQISIKKRRRSMRVCRNFFHGHLSSNINQYGNGFGWARTFDWKVRPLSLPAEAGATTKEATMNGFSCCTKRRGGIHLRLLVHGKRPLYSSGTHYPQ